MEIAVHDYYRCVDWDGENFGDCGGGGGGGDNSSDKLGNVCKL
jgi:hypothetical protein